MCIFEKEINSIENLNINFQYKTKGNNNMQIRPNNEAPNTMYYMWNKIWLTVTISHVVQTYVFGATQIIFLQIKLFSYIDSVEAYPR